jgi:mevalonate kinase
MVESVARFSERDRARFETTHEAITALVSNAALAVSAGDHPTLGTLMDNKHMLLAGWLL